MQSLDDSWIKVEDRLPDHNDEVLAYNAQPIHYDKVFLARHTKGFGWEEYWIEVYGNSMEWCECEVTHWQPLPEKPVN